MALEYAVPGQNGQFELSRAIADLFWQNSTADGGHPTVLYMGEFGSTLSWIYEAYRKVVKNYRNTVLRAGHQTISVQELEHDQGQEVPIPEMNDIFLPSEKMQEEMKQEFCGLCYAVKRSGRTAALEKLLLYLQKLLDTYCSHEICTEGEVQKLKEEIGACCSVRELVSCMDEFLKQ